jgi:hypothetical protein
MSVADADSTNAKLSWRGEIVAVQPRIRLTRSFDERSHTYLGYVLRLRGHVAGEAREFTIGIGKAAQAKHAFRVGDETSGEALPVADPRLEPVEYYKVSALKVWKRSVRWRHRHGWVCRRRSRHTGNAAIDVSMRAPTRRNANAVFGVAACRWKSFSTSGTQRRNGIASRRSAMARSPARRIAPVPRARYRVGAACSGKRKTG